MQGGMDGPETVDAILFMAHFYKKEGRLAEAAQLCTRLLDRPGPVSKIPSRIMNFIKIYL